jgi:putative phosphotransacetylase
MRKISIPVEISAKHIHLKKEHIARLFGKNHQLRFYKALSQSGDFAAKETLTVRGKRKDLKGLRVVGPARHYSQVELAVTDARNLEIDPPLTSSGELKRAVKIRLIGPKGSVDLRNGAMIQQRHLHLSPQEAIELRLKNGQLVEVNIPGRRGAMLKSVRAKILEGYHKALHLDTDEGNAVGHRPGLKGELFL